MSDPVYSVPAIAIPGLKIAYQIQIGEGQAIAYEAAVDSTLDRRDLDELLDRIGGAAERRKAMYDLPFHKARLAQNLELLPRIQRELAEAQAKAAAAQVQRRGERVREVPMTPQDMTAIGQIANRISETEKTIANDQLRIPYLEALIEGRPPPDLFPELKPEREYQPPRIVAAE